MPLVTLAGGAPLLGEEIRPVAVAGGALVLAGVYLGAFNPSIRWPLPGLSRRRPIAATEPARVSVPTLEGPCT